MLTISMNICMILIPQPLLKEAAPLEMDQAFSLALLFLTTLIGQRIILHLLERLMRLILTMQALRKEAIRTCLKGVRKS